MSPQILIVEDDLALGGLLERYCQRLGYSARRAVTAAEARAAFGPDLALAIVDLTLPDEPGDRLAAEWLGEHPELRVLLTSGYPSSVEVLPENLRGRARFLAKPFQPAELAERLESLKSD